MSIDAVSGLHTSSFILHTFLSCLVYDALRGYRQLWDELSELGFVGFDDDRIIELLNHVMHPFIVMYPFIIKS
jgi:hypothetical protein